MTTLTPVQYIDDASIRNKEWSLYSGIFNHEDITLIERHFLELLHWKLALSEPELFINVVNLSGLINGQTKLLSPV